MSLLFLRQLQKFEPDSIKVHQDVDKNLDFAQCIQETETLEELKEVLFAFFAPSWFKDGFEK